MSARPWSWVLASAFACLLAGCSSGSGANVDGSPCAAGEIEVTSCGGGEKACVKHAVATSCAAFDAAQPASDNPCNFGTRYSAACVEITAGRVSCACF